MREPEVDEATRVIDVLLLTQDGCKFCDRAKAILVRLGEEFPLRVSTAELSSPRAQALALEGGLLFPPGILIDGRPFSYGRQSEKKLRRELERICGQSSA